MVMEYDGYVGAIAYDDDEELFHGEVVNIRDVITFQGRSVKELKKALRDSVNFYREQCTKRGKEPEKPVSGKILLRVDPTLHRELLTAAALENKSLNTLVKETLAEYVHARHGR